MAMPNGGFAAAPSGPLWKRGPEALRGGSSGLNLFHGMEDAEEDEPGTPCTPAGQLLAGWPGDCPEAPDWRRKEMARCSSLKDTKLLLTTQLKRSHSVFLFDRHFEFLREVGRGSFSKVYEARDRRHGTLCAVKVSRKEFRSKGERERFLHEIESVAGLEEHPNIVNYYRSWQQDSHFYIQMELCEAGSLRQLLDGLLELMPEDEVWRSCKEIAAGLEFIHKAGVLHLDIKPENILIDKQGVLKIGDFGQAVMDQRWDWEDGDGGYLAPELLGAPALSPSGDSLSSGLQPSAAPTPTAACDMFSFGALLYEIATSEALPRSRLRVASTECNAGLAKAGRSPSLCALIRKLLDVNPAVRPTASDVLAWDANKTLGPSPAP